MENLDLKALMLSALLFGLLMAIAFVEEKIPSVKDARIFNWVKDFVIQVMLLCLLVAIVLFVVDWARQPSGYDRCMEGVSGQIDDKAIAWMEEYCSSDRSG